VGELDGKTCVVTGATAGIGKEVARNLAAAGATVVLPCRSLERGEAARADIARDVLGAKVELVKGDLSSQASLRELAAEVLKAHPRVDVLVNNAGVWNTTRQLSSDGIELTWATNVLAYHLLTALLLPALEAAGGRIVNVASTLAHGLDLSDVQFLRRSYDGMSAYAQSKQANRMLTWALAEKLGSKVSANAVHPGFVASELNRQERGLRGLAIKLGQLLAARSPRTGAFGATRLAMSRDAAGVTGKFWKDDREIRCSFRDPAQIRALWELCEKMTAPRT
jgi:NAD(P)-dependent dehydrogenase (short-subunit alcohol dehydrogenase family)